MTIETTSSRIEREPEQNSEQAIMLSPEREVSIWQIVLSKIFIPTQEIRIPRLDFPESPYPHPKIAPDQSQLLLKMQIQQHLLSMGR